jgi:hypothetical protein
MTIESKVSSIMSNQSERTCESESECGSWGPLQTYRQIHLLRHSKYDQSLQVRTCTETA